MGKIEDRPRGRLRKKLGDLPFGPFFRLLNIYSDTDIIGRIEEVTYRTD